MNKKGLSVVVASLLIVLITIAAVFIVWKAIKKSLESGEKEIEETDIASIMSGDVKIVSAYIYRENNKLFLTLENERNKEYSNIKVVVYNDSDSISYNFPTLKRFQRKSLSFILSDISNVIGVRIVSNNKIIDEKRVSYKGNYEENEEDNENPTPWHLDAWLYRKRINITENSGINLEDYPISILINSKSLISEGKLQSQCQDLRFTLENGEQIPYWIESGCNEENTKIWVRVPNIPAHSTITLYIYYGNNNAETGENFIDTFSEEKEIIGSEWIKIDPSACNDVLLYKGDVYLNCGSKIKKLNKTTGKLSQIGESLPSYTSAHGVGILNDYFYIACVLNNQLRVFRMPLTGGSWLPVGGNIINANWPLGLEPYNNEIWVGRGGYGLSSRIYKWNGNSWIDMGRGVPWNAYDFIVFNNQLYVTNTYGGAYIYKWNGYSWQQLTLLEERGAIDFNIINNELYVSVGGEEWCPDNMYGNGRVYKRIDDTTWQQIGEKIDKAVLYISNHKNSLYAATCSGSSLGDVYMFNGSSWISQNFHRRAKLVFSFGNILFASGVGYGDDKGMYIRRNYVYPEPTITIGREEHK